MWFRQFRRIYYFVGLLMLVILSGTFGYSWIEGWGWIDSFYMTIITVSTVGFGEVHDLTANGRIFTALLIIFSFGTFAFAIGSLTAYVVNGEYRVYLSQLKRKRNLENLHDHIIICGLGRVGKQVLVDLTEQGQKCLVIESDSEIIEHNSSEFYEMILGDSTSDELLKEAGIERAKALVTCLPKDADNIYVVLAARELNKNIKIISRASQTHAISKLKRAGATNVIMPDSIGGTHMAALVAKPDAMEFIDAIQVSGGHNSNVGTITYEQLPDAMKSKTIGDLDSKKTTGVTIIGYKTADGTHIINPGVDLVVQPGSKLFVLGSISQIDKFIEIYGVEE